MDCGVPFCHTGCPLGNIIPDWNDLVYRDQWQRGARPAARHEQLSRVHRPRLPGAVRSGLRAGNQRRSGGDQANRNGDRRSRLRRRLDRARAARRAHRQESGRRRQRAGRLGRGAATESGRPSGHGLRAGRSAGRTVDVRHSRFQAGKVSASGGGSSRWRPKGSSSVQRQRRRERADGRFAARLSTPFCCAAAPRKGAICRFPAAI